MICLNPVHYRLLSNLCRQIDSTSKYPNSKIPLRFSTTRNFAGSDSLKVNFPSVYLWLLNIYRIVHILNNSQLLKIIITCEIWIVIIPKSSILYLSDLSDLLIAKNRNDEKYDGVIITSTCPKPSSQSIESQR